MFEAIHNFALKVGSAVIGFFTGIDTQNLLNALEITGIGWLGIFVVTIVIILVVTLLTKISTKLSSNKE